MNDFDNLHTIPHTALAREAKQTPGRTAKTISDLESAGKIRPQRTATGRVNLTPPDAREVFLALTRK